MGRTWKNSIRQQSDKIVVKNIGLFGASCLKATVSLGIKGEKKQQQLRRMSRRRGGGREGGGRKVLGVGRGEYTRYLILKLLILRGFPTN